MRGAPYLEIKDTTKTIYVRLSGMLLPCHGEVSTLLQGSSSLSGAAVPAFDIENQAEIVAHAKRVLRKQMRGVRATIGAGVLTEKSEAIQQRLIQFSGFRKAKVVALCSVPPAQRGVETTLLAERSRALGKTVVYPSVDFGQQSVAFGEAHESSLVSRGLETAEAPSQAACLPPDAVDLIVVPVLAIDPIGRFIGDGSGVYDFVLQRMTPAVSVGIAFDFQLIPEAPSTSRDVPVAVVMTDRRVIEARGERSNEGVTASGRAAKEVRRAKQSDCVAGPCRRNGGASDWTCNYPRQGS